MMTPALYNLVHGVLVTVNAKKGEELPSAFYAGSGTEYLYAGVLILVGAFIYKYARFTRNQLSS